MSITKKAFKYAKGQIRINYVLIGAVLAMFLITFLFLFKLTRSSPATTIAGERKVDMGGCGDNICNNGENCWDCPKDCKCGENTYCSATKKECINTVCGNNICEPYETPYACCLDCKCSIPAEICNQETQRCEKQKMNISDETALNLTKIYFENQEKKIKSMEILDVSTYNNILIKEIRVEIEGDDWFTYIGVTDDGRVIELPIL
ncbi:hypothetical protein JW930_02730 [Candidatus Woesearchaeota archaeon]|nr:hypothetical protein [Candidatus Woesearchaeota archaeon]